MGWSWLPRLCVLASSGTGTQHPEVTLKSWGVGPTCGFIALGPSLLADCCGWLGMSPNTPHADRTGGTHMGVMTGVMGPETTTPHLHFTKLSTTTQQSPPKKRGNFFPIRVWRRPRMAEETRRCHTVSRSVRQDWSNSSFMAVYRYLRWVVWKWWFSQSWNFGCVLEGRANRLLQGMSLLRGSREGMCHSVVRDPPLCP